MPLCNQIKDSTIYVVRSFVTFGEVLSCFCLMFLEQLEETMILQRCVPCISCKFFRKLQLRPQLYEVVPLICRTNLCNKFGSLKAAPWRLYLVFRSSVVCRRVRRRRARGVTSRRRGSAIQLKRPKFSPLSRYEARIARVTITARPAIFMPAVTKLPGIIPSHWVRKAQIKPILYWTIFLESGGEICSLLDKKPRRLRYEIRKELHVIKSCFRINMRSLRRPPAAVLGCVFDCD